MYKQSDPFTLKNFKDPVHKEAMYLSPQARKKVKEFLSSSSVPFNHYKTNESKHPAVSTMRSEITPKASEFEDNIIENYKIGKRVMNKSFIFGLDKNLADPRQKTQSVDPSIMHSKNRAAVEHLKGEIQRHNFMLGS